MKWTGLVVALLLSILWRPTHAQWIQTNGPYGGDVGALAAAGTTLFAEVREEGVFRSTDNGYSWTTINAGLPESPVTSFIALGQNIFVGFLYAGVFLSTNNGTTWAQANNGLPLEFLWELAVSETNLLAATDHGVFVSTNNGTSWRAISNGLSNTWVRTLAVSGTNLFAGTYHGGVFRSTNRGASWTEANDGLTGGDVHDIAVLGTDLFAGTENGVFLSTDNGTHWTAVNGGLTDTWITRLAVLGTNLFAATDGGGVFLSTNSGTSWTAVNSGLSVTSVNAFAASGASLFVGTGCGVFLSTDVGSSWTQVSNGLMKLTVHALVVSGGNLFAAADDGCTGNWCAVRSPGVFLSTNDGTSWTTASRGLPNKRVRAVAAEGTNFFAGTEGGGVFLSTNNGGSWGAVNTGLMEWFSINALVISGGRIFAAGGYYSGHGDNNWYVGQGVHVSTDTGSTWTEANEGLPLSPTPGNPTSIIPITCLLSVGPNVFAGTDGGGVYLATNNGTSWAEANTGLEDSVICALAAVGTNLVTGTSADEGNRGGVFVSTNNGADWTRTGLGLPSGAVSHFAVAGTKVFAGTHNGVFLSTDNGTSWTDVNTGLADLSVQCLAVSGTDLLVGTNAGLWRRPLGEMVTSVEPVTCESPREYALLQNYPNPFNPSTTIRYALPERSHVTLAVFNPLGQQVATLVEGEMEAGHHEVTFDASSLASGVYLYRLTAGDYVQARKLVLLR